MYERSYGTKYAEFFRGAEGQRVWRTAAEIAKAIRVDIKAEVAAGTLPGKPVSYSVRVDNFSGGRSINIEIRDLEGAWREQFTAHGSAYQALSTEADAIQRRVKAIWDSYNYDASDSQSDYFDVNFYGNVSVESEWSRSYRVRNGAEKAAKRANKKVLIEQGLV